MAGGCGREERGATEFVLVAFKIDVADSYAGFIAKIQFGLQLVFANCYHGKVRRDGG